MELLKLGSKGKLVSYLQNRLLTLKYVVSVTGIFDAVTLKAVKDFQTASKLVADGIVGGLTWVELYLKIEGSRKAMSRTDRHNNILHLHPKVRVAVVKVHVQLQSEGIPFQIFEAFRYPERQTDLYAQGRTKPGNIVTYAKAWSSFHQYGLAVDFVLYINGAWSWDDGGTKLKWWSKMHEFGTAEGLMRLNFETPHLQILGVDVKDLRKGAYPVNGDKSWSENLASAKGK
ncbi:peptidoglycan-binding protein [Pedobacter nyackensis]|uniref:D-alanyl-D-alanine carboxypeptidase n=1 Tax=Pedobacter nyackensis TaxID=475255 RepID=A0A1W2A1M2_9SPHI|nr:peptidoglycan-binding protein [Pedobacter nyackensis]SMC54198.1 D-alanyl-D-alanine carboxypeptidase [Pedobacter nyackensis]